jgi:hypothetical protein
MQSETTSTSKQLNQATKQPTKQEEEEATSDNEQAG